MISAKSCAVGAGRPAPVQSWRLGFAWLALAVAAASGCRSTRDPIRFESGNLTVENQSSHPWSHIEVWVNDHYRVTAPALAAEGRLDVPLGAFVAGFGQRFDPRRQKVTGVEVTAESASGPVRLTWGAGRRR